MEWAALFDSEPSVTESNPAEWDSWRFIPEHSFRAVPPSKLLVIPKVLKFPHSLHLLRKISFIF